MRSRLQSWSSLAPTLVVMAIAYGPLLVSFFIGQWARPHYQFFPFVLGAFGWLLWQRCSEAHVRESAGEERSHFGSSSLLVMSWLLLAVAYVAASPWLALISLVLFVASQFVTVSRDWQVEYLWGIWILLLLVIPLPLNRDQRLITFLQRASSRFSSFLLDAAGINHLMEGNALLLPDKKLFVDEACSGIVSVLSIIACAVIYGVWRSRPPLHMMLLALAGVLWATLMNVIRITTIAIAYDLTGVDWSTGTPHEILGLVVFLFTFLALVCTDYLLKAILTPIVKGEQHAAPIQAGAWLVRLWDWLLSLGAPRRPTANTRSSTNERSVDLPTRFALGMIPLIAFGLLAVTQFTRSWWFSDFRTSNPQSMERALALDEKVLPERLNQLHRTEFSSPERTPDDIMGHHSRRYEYSDDPGNVFILSCDFPFGPDWHDLTACYLGIGWLLNDYRVVETKEPDGEPWNYVEAIFTKPDGSVAQLNYCVFDESGTRMAPPTHSFLSDLWRSLSKQQREANNLQMFQIQVWTTASGSISDMQRDTARQLLVDSRERLRSLVVPQNGQRPATEATTSAQTVEKKSDGS